MRKQHDPINQLRELLIKKNVREEALRAMDSEVKAVVTKATEFSQTSPEPDPSELLTDILLPLSLGTAASTGA